MSKSTIHQAKTQLSRLIEEAERGEDVVILRGENPVARIIPLRAAPKRRKLSNETVFDRLGARRIW